MPVKDTDSLAALKKKFFRIMRKYGVKKGTQTKSGYICNRFEWTVCQDKFIHSLMSRFNLNLEFEEVPKDLQY